MVLRRGMYFMVDSILALMLVALFLSLLPLLRESEPPLPSHMLIAQDAINVLSKLQIGAVDAPEVQNMISAGIIENANQSVLEAIGELWSQNKSEEAGNLSTIIFADLLPDGLSYGFFINNDPLVLDSIDNQSESLQVISARRLASGFEKGKPVYGYSTKAFLTGISSRKTSSIAYLGGFVGEGNLSFQLLLPQNVSLISAGVLEVAAGTDFKLYVNGQFAGDFPKDSGGGGHLVPDRWNLNASHLSLFVPGTNNISMRFQYISENATANGPAYVAGGYLRVDYETTSVEDLDLTYAADNVTATSYYRFPGIDGFVNLYDSFYVPGNLSSIALSLHVNHSYTVYVQIGNVTVHRSKGTGDATIVLTNATLGANLTADGMNFASLSERTIPIRVGFDNSSKFISPFDNILATDISNSMKRKVSDNTQGVERTCDDPLLNDATTARISAAKCAGYTYVDTILANEGPLLGLIGYNDDWVSAHGFSADSASLKGQIQGYDPKVDTCICCAINKAVDMFMNNSHVILIPRNSPGWTYLATGTTPPANWMNSSFSDAGWSSGTASFGAGTYNPATVIPRYVGNYYYRRKFNLSNPGAFVAGELSLASDDRVTEAYLNGVLIKNETVNHNAAYWNTITGYNTSALVEGENVLALKVLNTCSGGSCQPSSTFMDAELSASKTNGSVRKKSLIVMTDGDTNKQCQEDQGTGSAASDAIQAACEAYQNHSVVTYAVALGPEIDDIATLQQLVQCGGGKLYNASSAQELADVYKSIAEEIVSFTATQKANSTGEARSVLHPDSYLEFTFAPSLPKLPYGKIPVMVEGATFGNAGYGILNFPTSKSIAKVIVTSYSGDYWTDQVRLENTNVNQTMFALSAFGDDYRLLGDPYRISLPHSYFIPDTDNKVFVRTGVSPATPAATSPANRLIYELRIDSILGFGGSFFSNEGCHWNISYSDGTSDLVAFPSDYEGSRTCHFANGVYDPGNAIDDAAWRLFTSLDFDGDGILTIKFDENQLEFETLTTEDVPTLWGPASMELRIW